jgi:hypothetical protein
MSSQNQIEKDGYAVVPAVLSSSQMAELRQALASILEAVPAAGVRGLAEKAPCVRTLAHSPEVRALVEPLLGSKALLVRSILFNKSQAANWQVAWHQDLAIAVRNRAEIKGFVSWSVKDGVPHVQPPVAVGSTPISRTHP